MKGENSNFNQNKHQKSVQKSTTKRLEFEPAAKPDMGSGPESPLYEKPKETSHFFAKKKEGPIELSSDDEVSVQKKSIDSMYNENIDKNTTNNKRNGENFKRITLISEPEHHNTFELPSQNLVLNNVSTTTSKVSNYQANATNRVEKMRKKSISKNQCSGVVSDEHDYENNSPNKYYQTDAFFYVKDSEMAKDRDNKYSVMISKESLQIINSKCEVLNLKVSDLCQARFPEVLLHT